MVPYGYFNDSTMLLVLPGLLFALWAQFHVQSVFRRYQNVQSSRGFTAAQVAVSMLKENGITDIAVERVPGTLSDHYDPRTHTLRLSEGVYGSSSLAALGVAAHEVGHVLQHHDEYIPLKLRSAFVPVAQVGSYAAVPLFFLGLFMSWESLLWIGIGVFTAVVLFYLITLPVEYNASSRAIASLEAGGYLTYEEARPARKVLNAAGLTYVAAALQAALQLLRLLALSGGHRRRD
ncbi:MAG: zinc metallopeptidase [Firmicutes bacterium]|nr:zinc metallopeptidase [Bacillota bacterium]